MGKSAWSLPFLCSRRLQHDSIKEACALCPYYDSKFEDHYQEGAIRGSGSMSQPSCRSSDVRRQYSQAHKHRKTINPRSCPSSAINNYPQLRPETPQLKALQTGPRKFRMPHVASRRLLRSLEEAIENGVAQNIGHSLRLHSLCLCRGGPFSSGLRPPNLGLGASFFC